MDRAIKLFFTERDFVSAVTLACAAECIFGEYLLDRGEIPHIDELKPRLQSVFFQHLSTKEINDQYVNRARNFFKHKVDIPTAKFVLETEAISAIARSAYNGAIVGHPISQETVEFFTWLRNDRPHLIPTQAHLDELGL